MPLKEKEVTILTIRGSWMLIMKNFLPTSNERRALATVQCVADACSSKCSIHKTRLISLIEEDTFDVHKWGCEVINEGHVCRYSGCPGRT